MTISAGCDVGSLTSKAVIMENSTIKGHAIIKSRVNPSVSAEEVYALALESAGIKASDVAFAVGTGYGREKMNFTGKAISEIACHARGAKWLVPSASTVIDIGGQDCKVILIDAQGKIEKFITNDKCASGTGRFLEVMADVLGVTLDGLGELSEKTANPVTMASTCTVWAQADVIKYLNTGYSTAEIGAGVNLAMAKRVSIMASAIGLKNDICITGGVSKNEGVVNSLEKISGRKIKRARKFDPQFAGAIGAALLAAAERG